MGVARVMSSGLLVRMFRHTRKAGTDIRENRTPGRSTGIIQMSQRTRRGTGDGKEKARLGKLASESCSDDPGQRTKEKMIVTRKIRQLSRGKASQPYRFGAWRPRAGERIGKGKERKRLSHGTRYRQTREGERCGLWTVVLRQQHAPPGLSRSRAEAQHQQQQEDSDEGGV